MIGITGLAFEARIAADRYTDTICSSDGSTLAASLASAIAGECCGLISFGVAGGLSPDLPAGTCVVGSTIVAETTEHATDRNWSQALLRLNPDAVHGAIAGVTTIAAHPEARRKATARPHNSQRPARPTARTTAIPASPCCGCNAQAKPKPIQNSELRDQVGVRDLGRAGSAETLGLRIEVAAGSIRGRDFN